MASLLLVLRGMGWLLLLAGLAGLFGAGCSTAPGVRTTPSPTPSPTRAPSVSAKPSRQGLIDDMAVCHMLRVSQAQDAKVTDAAVVAALRQFKVSPGQVADRAAALVPQAKAMGSGFEPYAEGACSRLAGSTGVQSALVRAKAPPRPQTAPGVDRGGGVWVRVDGEIGVGFAKSVASRLQQEGAVGLIINSKGGNVSEARELGRYLRANGLKVAVDRACASACIDVLAGGVVRYVTRNAKIGVHQSSAPSSIGNHNTGQSYVAGSALYLREMGVDPGVALAAASVPPNKIYWIPTAEVIRTRLATDLIRSL